METEADIDGGRVGKDGDVAVAPQRTVVRALWAAGLVLALLMAVILGPAGCYRPAVRRPAAAGRSWMQLSPGERLRALGSGLRGK